MLRADFVVLALGNFDPAPLPGIRPELAQTGAYSHSAWATETFVGLRADDPVTLIGTGLTAVDVVLKLRDVGHRGIITAVSRHGMFPSRHASYDGPEGCAIEGKAPSTARELLERVHEALTSCSSWRSVVDSLRERTNELWLALSPSEQKRFRRHLLRRWELARHRMAPSVADTVDSELGRGTLIKARGNIEAILPKGNGATICVRTMEGVLRRIEAVRVINCTPPDMNYKRVNSPLLQSLFNQGLAMPGPLGLGLWSDEDGALRRSDGTFSRTFFCVGPARLGTLLESIAVPELRQQAAQVAAVLAAKDSGSKTIEQAA
jgi:hydroxyacylglutathione hydrolase